MDVNEYRYMSELLQRLPELKIIEKSIWQAYQLMAVCFENQNKLLIAGNGGSACDAQHIVAELMKGFILQRKLEDKEKERLCRIDGDRGKILAETIQGALPAIALDSHTGLNTAIINDMNPDLFFAQQIHGYGKAGDVFLAISTSGNSENVLYAAVMAKSRNMGIIGFTGNGGGELAGMADVIVKVPETEVYRIQDLQRPIYHCWCRMLEDRFFLFPNLTVRPEGE